MSIKPRLVDINWPKTFRLIPSIYPPIDLFEDLVDPSDYEVLCEIEMRTNPRLKETMPGINLVKKKDMLLGQGSTAVMAAFTHIGKASRFTDGTYGVYYAGKELRTAIKETIFHREIFMLATREEPGSIDMRTYIGKIVKPLHDVRSSKNENYNKLHHKTDYSYPQLIGKDLRSKDSWGIAYRSVRDPGSECLAAFRPTAVTIPCQGPHYCYEWDGNKISHYYEKSNMQTTS